MADRIVVADESEKEQRQEKNSKGDETIGKIVLGVVCLVFFAPAMVMTYAYYQLLRRVRLRPVVCFFISLFTILFCVFLWKATGISDRFVQVFSHIDKISQSWTQLVYPMMIVNAIAASIVGFILVYYAAHSMKVTPHLRNAEGSWEYQFQYRRTPFQYFLYKRRIKKLKNGDYASPEKAPLGLRLDYENRDEIVYRYQKEANSHTLLTGSTGSGKTITILSMILNDIASGESPTLMVDYKASPELTANLAAWAKEYGRPFYHFIGGDPEDYFANIDNGGQSYYVPLNGSPGVKASMMLGVREYDTNSEVYKKNMQQVLQVVFQALHRADREKTTHITWDQGDLKQLETAISDDNLLELALACEGTDAEKNINELVQKTRGKTQISHALEELQGQVRTLMASEYGRWLVKPTDPNARYIDLMELMKPSENPPVVLFSFNADSQKDFAQFMGSLVFADMTNMSQERRKRGYKNLVMIYADEFQSVPVTATNDLLEKGRASMLAVTLSAQSIRQIAIDTGKQEAHINNMLDNCSNFIIHNGTTQETAELFAGIVGKTQKTTYAVTSKNERQFFSWNFRNRRHQSPTSNTVVDWKLSPEEFMNLEKPSARGRAGAIVINKSSSDPRYKKQSGVLFRKTWMIPDKKVLEAASFAEAEAAEAQLVRLDGSLEGDENLGSEEKSLTPAEPSRQEESLRGNSKTIVPDEDSLESVFEEDLDSTVAKTPVKKKTSPNEGSAPSLSLSELIDDEEDEGDFNFSPIDEDEKEQGIDFFNHNATSFKPKTLNSRKNNEQ